MHTLPSKSITIADGAVDCLASLNLSARTALLPIVCLSGIIIMRHASSNPDPTEARRTHMSKAAGGKQEDTVGIPRRRASVAADSSILSIRIRTRLCLCPHPPVIPALHLTFCASLTAAPAAPLCRGPGRPGHLQA
jgi:hypothetical protein